MILSFAWTTSDYLAGRKCATRRFWTDDYAEKFYMVTSKNNMIFRAFDRSPRFKGREIGLARLKMKPFKQRLSDMTDADLNEEGTLWKNLDEYIEMMLSQNKGDNPYVVKFEPILVEKL